MTYDPERRLLFSGGFDQVIVVWDIGNQQGSAYELTGHTGKIRSLAYSSHTRKLLSSSEDGKLGVWDMDVDREETVEWAHSNICEKCSVPFFWNFRVMWDNKMIGVRQHHCRKCGRAVCSSCSDQQSTYPTMGYERPVRMCQDCHSSLTTDDRNPLAVFLSIKSPFTKIDFVQTKGLMITSSDDKQIKVWDVTSMMMNH
jgi:WD40 repeat protein